MLSVSSARGTEFFKSQLVRGLLSVFGGRVVFTFALIARKPDEFPHDIPQFEDYLMIFVTTPAPTVLPPSRIANFSPSSIAIGVIRVISMVILSPGMTISVPSGNLTTPVTSVVRK